MQTIGGLTIYCNRRIILLKTWWFASAMWWSLSPSCVQCGNMGWPLCAGQWSHYLQLLCFEFRCGGVLLYIRDDLSYNVTSTDPENLELLGFILYNGDSNRKLFWKVIHSNYESLFRIVWENWSECAFCLIFCNFSVPLLYIGFLKNGNN